MFVKHEEFMLWKVSVDFKIILKEVNKWECNHAKCSCFQENDKNNEEINEKKIRCKLIASSWVLDLLRLDSSQNSWLKYLSQIKMFNLSI